MKGLLPWDGVGAILASAAVGCAGYVGFTVAQVVSEATAADPGVVAVADPPPLATAPARPVTTGRTPAPSPTPTTFAAGPATPPSTQATTQPSTQATTQPTTQPTGPATTQRSPAGTATTGAPTTTATRQPGRRPAPGPLPATARTATRSTPRTTPAAERRREAAIKHALWADRQLAAMLRSTPQASLWFGGATWITPVAEYHLTARFGQSGSHWSSTHTGLDFAAPTGTPVRAATAGTVTSVGWAGAYGNRIEITHPDGTETWYAHLSRIDVRVGYQVATGSVIGAVGATGNVTGPHLHFEVRPGGGSPVDPDAALRQHGVRP